MKLSQKVLRISEHYFRYRACIHNCIAAKYCKYPGVIYSEFTFVDGSKVQCRLYLGTVEGVWLAC